MNNKIKDATAIVMGLSETGLSVARALGRRGINVIALHTGNRPSASYSRFLTYIKEPQTGSETERLSFFTNLGQKIGSRIVILPTFDKNVMFLSRNRDELKKNFLFYLPAHDLLESLTSKIHLIEIAEKYSIPLPASIRIKNEADVKNIPETFFPCVLKPEDQTMWMAKGASKIGIKGLKALPVMTKSELLSHYSRLKEMRLNLIAQKMVVGPDENHIDYHALVDSSGRIIGEFVGKKIRLTPPHFGMGCYVESIKSDRIVNTGRQILRSLGYSGIANVNFKIDERDDQIYFLELNPRFSFWTGLDVACGVDFPYYYYKLCLDERISPNKDYLIGKKWLHISRDIKGLKTLLQDGSLNWSQWIKSVANADVGAIYAADDPLPALMLPFLFLKKLMNFKRQDDTEPGG